VEARKVGDAPLYAAAMAALAKSWRRTPPLSGKPDTEPTSPNAESETRTGNFTGSVGTV